MNISYLRLRQMFAIRCKISFPLKSRSVQRLEIWSSLKLLRHVSTDKYQNRLFQSINCVKHRTAIKTTVSVRTLSLNLSQKFLSVNCLIRRTNCAFSTMAYTVDRRGPENTTDYRIYYKNSSGGPVSPWHDIPMFADEGNRIYNMVVEIPRWTNAKMEIATKEPLNPIKQDVKKGALRYVRNCFPHKGYIWNYGAIPQTWEDPNHLDELTGAKGDNDPIDVCEIGSRIPSRGEVIKIKVLGVMALIDEGETDWKVIAINVSDPLADQLNDIEDVELLLPGLMRATHEWFKIYKIPDGKPANQFAFNGEPKNREFAEKTIAETHKYWKELVSNTTNNSELDLKNTTQNNSYKIDVQNGVSLINQRQESAKLSAQPIDDQTAIDKWYYITLP